MKLTSSCLALVVSSLVFAQLATAQTILTITVDDGLGPVTLTPTGTPESDGTFNFDGTHIEAGRWSLVFPLNIDPDPHFQTLDGRWYDFTAMGNSIQDFSLSFETTVDRAYTTPILVDGDVKVGLDNPATGDRVGPNANNSPLTSLTIDGQNIAQMLRDFPGVSGTDSEMETLTPFVTTVGIADTIGMQLDFSLTPGATATFIANFEATPIPEPTAFALICFGVAIAIGRTRHLAER